MLHLVFTLSVATAALSRIAQGDSVLFINDAVIGILNDGKLAQAIREKSGAVQFFSLSEDLVLHGILPSQVIPDVQIIGYPDFVQLTVDNALIQSWH